ncbi:MAG: chemotaxis protein CheC [Endomicrobiales bacterium]
MENKPFTDLQMDAITEICGIASATAASALSSILDKKIMMRVPEIRILPIEAVTGVMGKTDSLVAGVYSRLIGDFNGGLLLTFPRDEVILLAEELIGAHDKTHSLSGLDASAICEVGNIISASFVSAISTIMKRTILISVPRLAFDMLGAIVDFILIELAENAEQALVMKIEFEDVPKTISGHFFILPNPGSLEMLLESIDLSSRQKGSGQ